MAKVTVKGKLTIADLGAKFFMQKNRYIEFIFSEHRFIQIRNEL